VDLGQVEIPSKIQLRTCNKTGAFRHQMEWSFSGAMDLQQVEYRHIASHVHPTLIESWCLLCGLFIAASQDLRKLKAAENSHRCQNYWPQADRADS
jgi:hypothetical protein